MALKSKAQMLNSRCEWIPIGCDLPMFSHKPAQILWKDEAIFGCCRQPNKIHLCGSHCTLSRSLQTRTRAHMTFTFTFCTEPIVLEDRQQDCVCPLTLYTLFENIDDGVIPLPQSCMGNAHSVVKKTASQKRMHAFNLGACIACFNLNWILTACTQSRQ